MNAPAIGAGIWALLLGILAGLAAMVLRRMSQLVARTRDLERFQRVAASLEARLAEATVPVTDALDSLRRHSGDPGALAAVLPGVQATVDQLLAEARALAAPGPLAAPASLLVAELERAGRAADLVEHGLAALEGDRGARELEAMTSLKRGELNLRHARDAVGRTVREVAALRPADLTGAAPAARASGPGDHRI